MGNHKETTNKISTTPPALPEKNNGLLVAKKDFVISHNDYFRQIKAGDNLADVPPIYLPNLKTEGVL